MRLIIDDHSEALTGTEAYVRLLDAVDRGVANGLEHVGMPVHQSGGLHMTIRTRIVAKVMAELSVLIHFETP